MAPLPIQIPPERIEDFCRRWKVSEFALFGSVLRDDFGPESDIDVVVDLMPNHGLSLYDWVDMEDELRAIFGRPIDLVLKSGLRNPFRRRAILGTRRVLYAA